MHRIGEDNSRLFYIFLWELGELKLNYCIRLRQCQLNPLGPDATVWAVHDGNRFCY